MENKYMREFLNLAETCSFQETAERMFISLSSLSKHISKIEEELGVPLFDRTTRSVKLSKYGIVFLDYVRQIINLCDEYENALNEIRLGDDNSLSIGFTAILGQYGIIEMLSAFSKKHPDISLNMIENNQPTDLLSSKKCDFVFDAEYGENKSSFKRLLYKVDNLVAVFPPNHKLANEKHVTIEQLRGQDFIMHHDPVSMQPQVFRKLCLEAGFEPNVIMTVSFTSTIVKLVSQGVGIAILNRMHTPTDKVKVNIVDIYPTVPFNIYAYYSEGDKMSPAEADFLNYIKTQKK